MKKKFLTEGRQEILFLSFQCVSVKPWPQSTLVDLFDEQSAAKLPYTLSELPYTKLLWRFVCFFILK